MRDIKGEGETVLLWCYNLRPEVQLLTDFSTVQWIRDYMVGNCKLIIGEAREKFATIAFGVSLGEIYTMMDPVGTTTTTDLGAFS